MITLTIYTKDGSVYWVSYFNTMDEMKVWLSDEMTRPYWEEGFTYEMVDNSALEAAQQAAILKQTQDKATAQDKLSSQMEALKSKVPKTQDDMNNLLSMICDYVKGM